MLKKKLLACGLTMAMITSLVACGSDEKPAGNETTSTPAVEDTEGGKPKPVPTLGSGIDDHSAIDASCIVNFEDDNISFLSKNDTDWSRDDDTVISVQSKYDSKVLHLTRPNGKVPAFAIDVLGLLGDKAGDVASITVDIGVDPADGVFAAAGINVVCFAGEGGSAMVETKANIFKAAAAMKTIKLDLGDAKLIPGEKNYLAITAVEDTATKPSSIVVDNIIFYDKDGKAIPVNTGIEFAVNGVGEYDWSNGVKAPANEKLLFTGDKTGGGWWPQAPNSWCWENCGNDGNHTHHYDLTTFPFGEGDIITVYYTIPAGDIANYQQVPYLRFQNNLPKDADGNEVDDGCAWHGNVDVWDKSYWEVWEDDMTPGETALVNESRNICQIPYSAVIAAIEAKGGTAADLDKIDFIGVADRGFEMTINAVTIGKAQ